MITLIKAADGKLIPACDIKEFRTSGEECTGDNAEFDHWQTYILYAILSQGKTEKIFEAEDFDTPGFFYSQNAIRGDNYNMVQKIRHRLEEIIQIAKTEVKIVDPTEFKK